MANELEDILPDSTPQEAATNIQGAKQVGTDPDTFRRMKPSIVSAQNAMVPPSRVISQQVGDSQEKRSLYKTSTKDILNFQNLIDYGKTVIDRGGLQRELNNIMFKRVWNEPMTEDEQFRASELREQLRTFKSREDYGLGFWEGAAADVAGSAVDMGRGLWEQKEIVAGATAAGAGVGALAGLGVGGPAGAGVLGPVGAVKGFTLGSLGAGAIDTFRQSAAGIYEEMSFDDAGESTPVPEHEKIAISKGGAVLMTLAETASDLTVAKSVPWLNKIVSPKAFRKWIANPANKAWTETIKALGTSMAAEGGAEGVQEFIQIVAGNMGDTWDGKETSLRQALQRTADEAGKNVKRVGEAATIGALAGGTFTGAGRTAGKVANMITGGGDRPPAIVQQGEGPTEFKSRPKIDLVGGYKNLPSVNKGTRALQVKELMKGASDSTKNTELMKLAPEEMDETRRLTLEEAGIDYVYLDKADISKWAADDKKAEQVRSWLDASGQAAAELNGALRVESHKFLRAVDQFPELADFAKTAPEEMSYSQYQAAKEKAQERRKEILQDFPEPAEGEVQGPIDERVAKRIESHNEVIATKSQQLVEVDARVAELQAKPDKDGADLQKLAELLVARGKLGEDIGKAQARVDLLTKVDPSGRIFDEDIFSEIDFTEQTIINDVVGKGLPPTELAGITEAERQARLAIVESVDDAAEAEWNQVVGVQEQIANAVEDEEFAKTVQNDPGIRVVDDFLKNLKVLGDLTPDMKARKDRGLPVYAINPASLTEAQRNRYVKDKAMTTRKVFSTKGVHINDAALAMGVKDGDELLKILSSVPNSEQAAKLARQARAGILRIESEGAVDLNSVAIGKAYNKLSTNRSQQMKILLEQYWPTVKGAIKRTVKGIKPVAEIRSDAVNTIQTTPIKALNVNQWKLAEKSSMLMATDALTSGKFERWSHEMENARMNIELARATHGAIKSLNRANKLIATLKTERAQEILKSAGRGYVEGVQLFLDLFEFGPKSMDMKKTEQYERLVTRLIREGKGDMQIPREALSFLSTKQNARDLTVEQYIHIADNLEAIYTQARLKNRLLEKYMEAGHRQTEDMIAEQVNYRATQHPDYDEAKATEGQGERNILQDTARYFQNAVNLVKNVEFVTLQLDQGKLGGTFSKLIFQPLAGVGEFEQSGFGKTATVKLAGDVSKEFDKHVKAYGKKEFLQLGIQKVRVPEFEGIPRLKNGRMTKLDLLMMQMHMGTQSNIDEMNRSFGVSESTMRSVLRRELSQKDFDFVQNGVWNVFNSFVPRIAALEKMTKGIDAKFIEHKGFTEFGKEYPGGYMPIKRMFDGDAETVSAQAEHDVKVAKGEIPEEQMRGYGYDGIVRSPFTKERTGSDLAINIAPETLAASFNEVIYDLTMRVPVRDVTQILANKSVSHDLASILGVRRLEFLKAAVDEMTKSRTAEDIMKFGAWQSMLNNAMSNVQGAFIVNQLLGNITTIAIQGAAMRNALQKMGVASGTKHLGFAIAKIVSPNNWTRMKETFQWAAELDPSIETARQSIDDRTHDAIAAKLPKKRVIASKSWNFVRRFQEGANEAFFRGVLGNVDILMKMSTAIAGYNQFMAGEAQGYGLDVLAKMSDDERHRAAKAYVAELSFTSLTSGTDLDRAAIQKIPLGKPIAMFFNDARNSLNSNMQELRNVNYDLKKAIDAGKNGNFAEANLHFSGAGDRAARMLFLSATGMLIVAALRGKNPVKEEDEEELTMSETLGRVPGYIADKMTSPYDLFVEMFGQHVPLLRSMIYAGQYTSRQGVATVKEPMAAILSDATTSAATLPQMYNAWHEGATWFEASQSLSDQQMKAVGSTLSAFVGGIGTNAMFKYYRVLRDNEDSPASALPSDLAALALGAIGLLLGNETDDERLKRLEEETAQDEVNAMKNQAEDFRQTFAADRLAGTDPLSDEQYEQIMYTESGGDSNARTGWETDENGNIVEDRYGNRKRLSNAYGPYQFVPGTWRAMMEKYPELGLTMEGYEAPDLEQHELAMRQLTIENSEALERLGITSNLTNIYGAHHFGPETVAKVLRTAIKSPNTSIKKLLDSSDLRANPQILRGGFTKAKDFSRYLRAALARGQRAQEAAKALTKNVPD